MRFEPVDPSDDVRFAAWYDVYAGAVREGVGEAAVAWMPAELLAELRADSPQRWKQAWLALDGADQAIVGAGFVSTPLMDNLTTATVEAYVLPAHRRQGIGSAILRQLESVVAERGRTVLDSEAQWPSHLGTDGAGSPGVEFGRRHGYAVVLSDVERRLDLPVSEDVLAELAAEAAPHHADYELRCWVGPVPDDIAESWVELSASLMTEAPTGERELEPERSDVATLRSNEQILVAQGRTRYHCAALDAQGAVVAYTDIVTPEHEPGRGYQWGTLVRGDHRGHRLGLAVKVANLAQLQASRPDVTHIITFNAEVNDHMIGINERLGFRAVGRLGELQKRVS